MSAVITARPAQCYAALADYHVAHPKIVPPRYFGPIVVERGGVGAGTRITCSLKLLGKVHTFASEITEPVPGRVLVERLEETGAVTTFTVVPHGNSRARVTIDTKIPRRPGLGGWLERLVTRRVFPRIYNEELERLAHHIGGAVLGSPTVSLDG